MHAHVQERLLAGQSTKLTQGTAPLQSNQVRLHPDSREVYYRDEKLSLTRKEYSMLQLFLAHPGQVFTRDELLDRVWGYDQYPETRTVDTHVMQLRQKLSNELIETIRGVGYRWSKHTSSNLTQD